MSTWIAHENLAGSLACRRVRRVLQSYLDGALDDATARRVARHLEGCRRCVREAETYLAIKNSLSRRRQGAPEAVQRLRDFGEALLDDPGETSPTQRSVRG
ncbi:MAG: anti-sigma factor family protein [Pseudonocardiaceae bacterium]